MLPKIGFWNKLTFMSLRTVLMYVLCLKVKLSQLFQPLYICPHFLKKHTWLKLFFHLLPHHSLPCLKMNLEKYFKGLKYTSPKNVWGGLVFAGNPIKIRQKLWSRMDETQYFYDYCSFQRNTTHPQWLAIVLELGQELFCWYK